MLFNSVEFIFFFLPIVVIGYSGIGKVGSNQLQLIWLVVASLFFYAWWRPPYLILLIISIIFNYAIGKVLSREQTRRTRKFFLILGITVNLLLLGYYKYANFFVGTVNSLVGSSWTLDKIILPLGISFFTFQQIAYLVDVYREETKEHNFLKYSFFVSFFPLLIAGPIVHHQQILPQFSESPRSRFTAENIFIGLTIFFMGFFKKVIFADGIAAYSNPIFNAANQGISINFIEAWVGVLAFTFQLYFDFSGYSDMAIGGARLFGIKFPLNFNSPYQSVNIIDFWRRWHITLSNFLKDYLYIPLGGNRKGEAQRNLNLMLTMLLGGLWHGASWTFVLWGGLHGLYLVINQQWRSFRKKVLGHVLNQRSVLGDWLGRILMFLAVIVGWVFFRAENLQSAKILLSGMIGLNGLSLPPFLSKYLKPLQDLGIEFNGLMPHFEINPWYALSGITILLGIVWFTPNTQVWMARYHPTLNEVETQTASQQLHPFWKQLEWQPNLIYGMGVGILIFMGFKTFFEAAPSDFLYFKF